MSLDVFFFLAFLWERFRFALAANKFSTDFANEAELTNSSKSIWNGLKAGEFKSDEEQGDDFLMLDDDEEFFKQLKGGKEEEEQEEDDDRDSQLSSSILSETFLEDLGLRNPRTSDEPFLSSCPHSPIMDRIRNSSSRRLLSGNDSRSEDQFGGVKSDEDEEEVEEEDYSVDYYEPQEIADIRFSYEGDFMLVDSINDSAVVNLSDAKSEVEDSSSVKNSSSSEIKVEPICAGILSLPNAVISELLEYCDIKSLISCRSTCRTFKAACSNYLKLLYNVTYLPKGKEPKPLEFIDTFSLLSIMMTFYRNQPDVYNFIQELLADKSLKEQKSWDSMNLIELYDSNLFHKWRIFSDEFIESMLIPHLLRIPLSGFSEPSPLFLLGEALIRSRRVKLFNRALLQLLNQSSVLLMSGYYDINPQGIGLMSPGFMEFDSDNASMAEVPESNTLDTENMIEYVNNSGVGVIEEDDALIKESRGSDLRVLGVTLHCAINFGLILTVSHLIDLEPRKLLQMKNHQGKTALMLIADILKKYRFKQKLPGPDLSVQRTPEWIADLSDKFLTGKSLQTVFPGNSRLMIEMFLKIVQRVSERVHPEDPGAVVRFLGLNEQVEFLTENSLQVGSILIELVSGLQYDLIFWLGLRFGDLIDFRVHAKTPLHIASEMNDPAMVAILLQLFTKMDVNQLVSSGNSALDLAVSASSLESVKVLLEDPRCDPNRQINISPLVRSIEMGKVEVVQILLAHPQIDIHKKFTTRLIKHRVFFALKSALTSHKWEISKMLLRHPAGHLYSDDSDALTELSKAEAILLKRSEQNSELLQMIKAVKMPTIKE